MRLSLRLYNISLFLLALLSVIRYGTRKKLPKGAPKKVLVVQLAKLGDMVCITPVLNALRKSLPETKIYVLGNSINQEVLQGNTDVDEYIVFEKGKTLSVAQTLRKENIDVACLRGTGYIGLVAVLLSGIPSVIATRLVEGKGFATRTYRWLLPYVRTVDFRLGEYMPRQFLKLLEPLGIFSDDTKKHLAFSPEAKKKVDGFFKENGLDTSTQFIAGISPSAGNKIKEWPEARFAELADHLIEKHSAQVVLIGGPGDQEKLRSVLGHMRNREAAVDTECQFSIDETKALISKLALFISVDTGPIYIAEAFGVPTVDIVGPVDEREQPPRGPLNRNVVPERTRPELSILNARLYDRKEALRQTLAITSKQVIDVADTVIQDIRENKTLRYTG